MGAWIEIFKDSQITIFEGVAPYMGAWIEIFRCGHFPWMGGSLPTWGRGLK